MNWTLMPINSKAIVLVAYNMQLQAMVVFFTPSSKKHTINAYTYYHVPTVTWAALVQAGNVDGESAGKLFHEQIRSQYPYERFLGWDQVRTSPQSIGALVQDLIAAQKIKPLAA